MESRRVPLAVALLLIAATDAFNGSGIPTKSSGRASQLTAVPTDRRAFLASSAGITTTFQFAGLSVATDATTKSMIDELEESEAKLSKVPDLLQKQQWDQVRTILKSPPINNLWNMGDAKNTILNLARATDEVELIELKDELAISLQMCDQLTYDNVFVYFQPGSGKVKVKEPTDLAVKALSQLGNAIDIAKAAST